MVGSDRRAQYELCTLVLYLVHNNLRPMEHVFTSTAGASSICPGIDGQRILFRPISVAQIGIKRIVLTTISARLRRCKRYESERLLDEASTQVNSEAHVALTRHV